MVTASKRFGNSTADVYIGTGPNSTTGLQSLTDNDGINDLRIIWILIIFMFVIIIVFFILSVSCLVHIRYKIKTPSMRNAVPDEVEHEAREVLQIQPGPEAHVEPPSDRQSDLLRALLQRPPPDSTPRADARGPDQACPGEANHYEVTPGSYLRALNPSASSVEPAQDYIELRVMPSASASESQPHDHFTYAATSAPPMSVAVGPGEPTQQTVAPPAAHESSVHPAPIPASQIVAPVPPAAAATATAPIATAPTHQPNINSVARGDDSRSPTATVQPGDDDTFLVFSSC